MKCAELELLLCDYIDGTLPAAERQQAEVHLSSCSECAELAADCQGAVSFVGRVAELEPPPALITKILQQAPPQQPASLRAKGVVAGLFGRWFQPVMQPRMVMGMAMTILSFAMLGRFAGIEARQLRAADLHPANVWMAAEDQAHRVWNRAVKYYENLRFVYEIQSRLSEITDSEDGDRPADRTKDAADGAGAAENAPGGRK